ncbi:MAG: FtsX-like permease family protein, partial [Clostridia bacterium]
KLPTAFNEVIISNYLADLIIYYGKAILDKNGDIIENADGSIENTKFKNYAQILDEFYFTKYGEKYKVVGIINYELKEFESLKTQVIGDITNKTNYLNTSTVAAVGGLEASGEYLSLVKLINKYSTSLSNIYVSNNFCEEVYKTIKTMPVTINYSNKQIWQQLKNKENFTNNNCIGLPNNEGIIAPISLFLNEVEYAKKFSNTNYETILNAFFDSIKGSLLTGYINIDEDINEPISQQVVAIYDDYKTEKRGVLFLDNDQFLQVAKKFARKNDNYGVIKVLGNEKAIETLFKEQAQADSRKFNIYFEESGFINMSTENYAIFAVIFCVFAIIAMILATVFIIYSINQNLKLYKRDYGIVKSLGFSNANLSKFYMCDSVIAFLMALIIGIIFGVIIMFVINFYLIQKIVDVVIVGYMWATPFIIVTILMLVFLFTFFISGKKIRKDPPINSLIGR